MSLAVRRTESVGILGRRLRRHLHSLLWSDHAFFCRGRTFLQTETHTNKHTHPHTPTLYLAIDIAVASHLALGTPQQGLVSRQKET